MKEIDIISNIVQLYDEKIFTDEEVIGKIKVVLKGNMNNDTPKGDKVTPRRRDKLTNSEIAYIKNNLDKMSLSIIAKKLGRGHTTIWYTAKKIREGNVKIEDKAYDRFTTGEDNFIKRSVTKLSLPEIAEALGRKELSIRDRIKRLKSQGDL